MIVEKSHKKSFLYLGLLFILAEVSFHLNPDCYLSDDAFFYLQIARNFIGGGGWTFHHICPTNGFHPLWQWTCTFVAWAVGNDKTLLLHAAALFQMGILSISLFLFMRLGDSLRLQHLPLGVGLIGVFFIFLGATRLFETHLSLLFQLLLIDRALKVYKDPTRRHLFYFSILSSLTFLARLDNVFVIGSFHIILLGLIVRSDGNQKWRDIACLILPEIFVVTPYLVYNFLTNGHIVPISGYIKTQFPELQFNLARLGSFGLWVTLPSIFCLFGFSLFYFFSKKSRLLEKSFLYSALFLGLLLHTAYLAGFCTGITKWYHSTAYFCLSLMAMEVAYWIGQLIESKYHLRLYSTVNALSLATITLLFGVSWLYYNLTFEVDKSHEWVISKRQAPGREVAELMKCSLGEEERIFVFDSPGILAYYSDRDILPLDGLVNDFHFLEEMRKGRVVEYLKDHSVTYFLAPYPVGQQSQVPWIDYFPSEKGFKAKIFTPKMPSSLSGEVDLHEHALLWKTVNPVDSIRCHYPNVALWRLEV